MSLAGGAMLFGLAGALLVGLGVYGLIVSVQPLRKLLALNVIGTGAFMLFGAVARRGAAAGLAGDPVPQALVITGIVVAFAATALAAAIMLRLARVAGSTDFDDAALENRSAPERADRQA